MTHEDDLRLREVHAEIKRLDQVLVEREKQTNLALDAAQRAITRSDDEALRAHAASNEWRGAMDDREKHLVSQEAHDTLANQVDYLRRGIDQATGRRTAWIAAMGIIATLLAIAIGQVIRGGVTSSDVSNQIQREAPWNQDKPEYNRRLSTLERENERLRIAISRLQQRDEFFCVTRIAAGLPSC